MHNNSRSYNETNAVSSPRHSIEKRSFHNSAFLSGRLFNAGEVAIIGSTLVVKFLLFKE